MGKVIRITIDVEVPDGAQVSTTTTNTTTTTKSKANASTTNTKAKAVNPANAKRINSIVRLVKQIKDKNIDYKSALEQEDIQTLFLNKDIQGALANKTENQLKRYQAILLALLKGESQQPETEPQPPVVPTETSPEDEVEF